MMWPFIVGVLVVISIHSAHAADLSCVSTTFNALSPNDKACVSVFEDPQVPGIVCYISQARKGGWGQPFGLNEEPSNFSVACRAQSTLTYQSYAKMKRFLARKRAFFSRRLVYLAIGTKIINGSPANAISTVPIMQWPTR
jgi:CreA protein